MEKENPLSTGLAVRLAARDKTLMTPTAGLAPSYLQANLIVLPSRYASDFRLLCQRNPVPCPLLAESSFPGAYSSLTWHLPPPTSHPSRQNMDIDLRQDAPKYRIYKDGIPTDSESDPLGITSYWDKTDHIGFLIGCSYSFENALAEAGLPPRYVLQGRNVAMYRTKIPLAPAGVFTRATWVVSMRPYRVEDVERVREVTREFGRTHGEPVDWGWDAVERLGIEDITRPEWGEAARTEDGEGVFDQGEEGWVPVFWGCGVTPQEAVMKAGLKGTVLAHSPGHMIVLDLLDEEVKGL